MNKLIRHTIIAFTLLFAVTSCTNRLTLAKRHYSKGYYFAKTPAVKSPQAQKSTKINTVKTAIAAKQTNNGNINVLPQQSQETAIVVSANDKVKVKQAKKIENKTENLMSLQGFTFNNEKPKVYNRHTFSLSANKEQESENEARSLFWIVVVVLIVLWALGLISGGFGLGIIFNLLLVIALVLLILWLLRII